MTQKMNPEWKTKWLEALRSGEYSQGTTRLRRSDDTYCCLGVLVDLCIREGAVDYGWEETGLGYFATGPHGQILATEGDTASLPAEVASLAEIHSMGKRGDGRAALYALNDSHGLSFEEIANVIEEEF